MSSEWAETNSKWTETNSEWAETNSKWTETSSEWAETNSEWTETNSKWTETSSGWIEMSSKKIFLCSKEHKKEDFFISQIFLFYQIFYNFSCEYKSCRGGNKRNTSGNTSFFRLFFLIYLFNHRGYGLFL